MAKSPYLSWMPSKFGCQLVVLFCLMSIIPILSGVYIGSIFIRFPFEVNAANLFRISLISILSLGLSLLGYHLARQWVSPLEKAATAAKRIAHGLIPDDTEFKGAEEIEELSRSLRAISLNARELLEKVDRLSPKDKLTGLYNVSYIRERLEEEIQRAMQSQDPCSFAYLRVGGCKPYESQFGAAAVDEALAAIAGLIGAEMAVFDRAARASKEEFAVILPNRNKKKAIEIIERLMKKIGNLEFIGAPNAPGKLSVTAGISENPIDGTTADELYARAEVRMKLAKVQGKCLEAFDNTAAFKPESGPR